MADLRVSVAVMAHPRRIEAARRLRDSHPELGVRIAVDPEPDAPPATLRTSLRAWKAIADDATHHLVVQDDAVLCQDFPSRLAAVVESRPEAPLALFTDWGSRTAHMARLAALAGASWAEAVDVVAPAHSMVLLAGLAREFAAHAEAAAASGAADDAVVLGEFLAGRGLTVHACVPNIVDHSCVPSLLGHDLLMGVRRSVCFADGDDGAPAPWWSSEAFGGLRVTPHFSTRQGGAVCHVRDGDGDRQAHPALDWLASRGIGRHDLAAWFGRDHADSPSAAEVTQAISPVLAFDLWQTAFLYGLCLPARGPGGPEEPPAPGGHAARALATLVPGVVRRVLPEAASHRLARAAAPLLGNAMERGRRTDAGPGVRWSPC
ncbi:hypothetical protein AGRA3207_003286 [Actinomadura graeca]|uniref:Glycosyltransferase n=1 Tax=Actinomadura graeca TaxID=2750812 RepID=A0ABX8QU61_9ACTN|nr:hypothetical protein [Actinomadura graeca]QXJ22303.1 hypothetical protein AGRA3207_003286 [Actinomadura graeca]